MDNLQEKEKYLWYYNCFLELAQLELEVYSKTGNKLFYDFALDFVKTAGDYKNKLKIL